jgi:hypothetical protein
MKRLFVLLIVVLSFVVLVAPAAAQSGSGVTVTCDNGASFDNGVMVTVVEMRSGFNYTATAVGLNGFDPVLAVLNNDGTGLCADDDRVAAQYDAVLPTTGTVPASPLSSQVRFSQNSASAFADVNLVVGGFGNTSGEFLLILEGMAVTEGDAGGDPFRIDITPGMVNSGVPLTVYMISRESTLDPLVYGIDAQGNYLADDSGNAVYCDDAGTSSCWGENVSLDGYAVMTEAGGLGGFQYDSMLNFPLSEDYIGGTFNLLMTSYQQSTLGRYVMVFHMGTGGAISGKPNA